MRAATSSAVPLPHPAASRRAKRDPQVNRWLTAAAGERRASRSEIPVMCLTTSPKLRKVIGKERGKSYAGTGARRKHQQSSAPLFWPPGGGKAAPDPG